MGQRIVIIGAGGMGREAAAWVAATGRAGEVIGFVDADTSLHGNVVAGLPVLGGTDWLDHNLDVQVVVAIGSPARRAGLVAQLDGMGVRLATVIHPSATIGPRVTIEDGAIICPGVLLTCDVSVGRAAIVNYGAMVGHDGALGACVFVAPGVHLAGDVTVGTEADVGIGASVIQGIHIGERSVVGAGAVVIRDVAADTTVVGVPARPLPPAG